MNVIVIVTIVRRNKHEDECGAASRRAITDPSFPAQPIPYYYSSTVCNPLAQFSTSSTISASASPQSTHPTMNVLSHSRCAVLRIGIRTHLDDLLQPLWSNDQHVRIHPRCSDGLCTLLLHDDLAHFARVDVTHFGATPCLVKQQ
jgi:hypothetical protein